MITKKSSIKVMIVDDSALVRQALTDILQEDTDFEVIACAQDPFVAVEKLKKQIPDVIILDVEMPRMDGVTFLTKLMSQHPIPVVICSTLAGQGSLTQIKALEAGAVDIICKPTSGTRQFIHESKLLIHQAVKAAAKARVKRHLQSKPAVTEKISAESVIPKLNYSAMAETTEKIIVIGASTGGTEAIREVLQGMPLGCPGIVVVQHMPEGFTASFAERLDSLCSIRVREARDGEPILRGQALIAPGNQHALIKRSGAKYFVQVKEGPLVSRHRPSVDMLFRSAAKYAGANAAAAILTGMGADGAKGMLDLFKTGAWTCAQDEKSSIVFGMPKEAYNIGATERLLPLNQITHHLLQATK